MLSWRSSRLRRPTAASVPAFLKSIADDDRLKDCHDAGAHHEQDARARTPRAAGTSIVGFGSYELQVRERQHRRLDPIIGFSPRKQDLTLYRLGRGIDGPYAAEGWARQTQEMKGGCLYIKRLSDVDLAVLEKVVSASVKHMTANG